MYSNPPLPPRPLVGRRAGNPSFGDPQGVEALCVRLYIGLRHFVPRPMPMERASFGCRHATKAGKFVQSVRPVRLARQDRHSAGACTPTGVLHLTGAWGFFPTELCRGLRRGIRPSSTTGLNTEHPCRGASLPAIPAGALIPLANTITITPAGVPCSPFFTMS